MKHLPIAGLVGFFLLLHVLGEDEKLFQSKQVDKSLYSLLTPSSTDDSYHRDELSKILIQQLWRNEHDKAALYPFPSFTNVLDFFQSSNWNEKVNVSDYCKVKLHQFQEKRRNGDAGALQMWDASGKPSSGFLWGNWFALGYYSQCVDVKNKGLANSTYFLITITITSEYNRFNNVTPHAYLGLCLPEECSTTDIKNAVEESLKILPTTLQRSVIEVNVDAKNKHNISVWDDTRSRFSIYVLSTLLILTVIATIYDGFHFGHEEILPIRILQAFSAKRNFRNIFDTKTSDNSVSCIHGIKVLSMLWIIFGHTFYYGIGIYEIPLKNETANSFWFQIVICGISAVTSFVTISGFLLSYIFFTNLKEKGTVQFGLKECALVIINRYIRLIVPFASAFFLFYYTTANYLSYGPLWPQDEFLTHCKSNWWRNILFLNSFYSITEMCCEWSWFLSVEMALLFLGVLFFFVFTRSQIGALLFWIGSLIGSWAFGAYLINYQKFENGKDHIILAKHTSVTAADVMYNRPHFNFGPYLMGIAVAYLVVMQKSLLSNLPKIVWIFGWIVAIGAAFVNIFGLYLFEWEDAIVLSSTILAMSRSGWGYVIAWTLLTSISGKAGFVTSVLSWRGFVPLSRLTFSMYLIHPLIMQTVFHSSETPIHHSHFITITLAMGFQVASFLGALLFSLLIESPVIAFDRVVRRPQVKPKES